MCEGGRKEVRGRERGRAREGERRCEGGKKEDVEVSPAVRLSSTTQSNARPEKKKSPSFFAYLLVLVHFLVRGSPELKRRAGVALSSERVDFEGSGSG